MKNFYLASVSNELPEYSKQFYQKTAEVKEKYGITEDFNYEDFYNISNIRKDIASKIKFYLKDIEKIEFVTKKDNNKQIER